MSREETAVAKRARPELACGRPVTIQALPKIKTMPLDALLRFAVRTGLATLLLAAAAPAAWAFGFDDVTRQAAALAAEPYREPAIEPAATGFSYDQRRAIRFRSDRALWRDAPGLFELQFFARAGDRTGGGTRRVELHEVESGRVRPIEVPPSAFTSGGARGPAAGAAGWRAHYPLNRADHRDELIAFLGASYFRALGAGLHYGASARGLAIDTVGGRGEEFPAFTQFWFERPAPDARELRFWALLDSPRAAGAYAFSVKPGRTTVVEVQARLWLRAPVATLGIAPITSMFFSGENQPPRGDYRPEVHDSDGLQIAGASGEWLWRPLTNPARTFVTSFAQRSPRGFGLMQRDRAFASYEDLETRYEQRPSVWVEPVGDWGAGRVELLQFPTPDETHDNVVAYWVPEKLPAPGERLDLAWRVHWAGDDAPAPPGARTLQSRAGIGYKRDDMPAGLQQLHVDFAPVAPPSSAANAPGTTDAEVQAVASANDNVRNLQAIAYPNAQRGGWRVSLDFERIDKARPVELRLFLRRGAQTLSETWTYALSPE